MKKRVNIYPRGPITTVNPPIRSVVKAVTKEISDIRKCILAGAKVEEVINNYITIELNLNNYDKDNGGSENPMPLDVKFDNAAPPIEEDLPDPDPEKIETVDEPPAINIEAPEDIKAPDMTVEVEKTYIVENDEEDIELSFDKPPEEAPKPYKTMTKKEKRRAKALAAAQKLKEAKEKEETEQKQEQVEELKQYPIEEQ